MFDWLATEDRLERSRAAINSKDLAAVASLKAELQKQIDALEAKMKEHGVIDVREGIRGDRRLMRGQETDEETCDRRLMRGPVFDAFAKHWGVNCDLRS